MKLICTKYENQGGPGATYNGKQLTRGVVELVNGNELLNRINVDSYGHTNYDGDNWSDKYYDEFITYPSFTEKRGTAPIALREKKHWFESGDLTQDQFKEKKARDTALATIQAFKDSVCEDNANTIKEYYKAKMADAKANYEKELSNLYKQMQNEMGKDLLLPYAKLSEKDFKAFSNKRTVY